ncbi:MAG: TolC family protein [Candidatus Korobacteraceae bacterium]
MPASKKGPSWRIPATLSARLAQLMAVAALLVGLVSSAAAQQSTPLTLTEAVQMTLDKNPMHKAALADIKAALASVREARSPLLPRLMFAENFTGGNDPVFVFGTKLRQQIFTAQDFALNSLNRPTPIGNYATRFSGQWSLFDSMQSWMGMDRAKFMSRAADQQLSRTDQELVFQTVQAYYAVLLAQKQLQVAEDALKTAEAIEQQSRTRVESGMAVDSDLLSAQVLTSSRKQERIARQNELALARTRLALAMGMPADAVYEPKEALEERTFPPADVNQLEKTALEKRPDLKRIESERSAQMKSVSMAKAAFGPRLNAFGSWEEDSHAVGWTGANNWVAGAELQFDLFSGGSKRAALAREKALAERATAAQAGVEDAIRLEVRTAYYDFDAAQQEVAVARSAIAQADESLRINENRYEGGLSTVTDMLRVEDAAHRAKADYWQAVYRMDTSYAGVELATGTLTPNSPAVTR